MSDTKEGDAKEGDAKEVEPGCTPAVSKPAMGSPKQQPEITQHTIKVKAAANGNSVDWELNGKKPDESKLKLDRDSGGHEIKFDLDPDHVLKGRGLRFNCGYPIFVHDNVATCPSSGIDSQIEVLECSRGSLTIFDKNSGPSKMLRYQLNFVEDDGAAPVCDPIIENGGST
ncbi:MAG TPA: hypothetical protein VFU20_02155 [Sphingomicrobium sp.]|nr:hypothetical protein [Sphingomicrobium sp.]